MSGRAWAAFAAVSILWGVPYFLMKVAVAEVSPPVISATRLALGGIVLIPIAWRSGALAPALKRWPVVAALGVAYLAFALTLIPLAETWISSSETAILIATVPMVVALISLAWERPTAREVAGLLIGFAGVATLVGLDFAVDAKQLLGVGLLLLVALTYALGPIVSNRKLAGVPPLGYLPPAMLVGATALLPAAVAARPERLPSLPVIAALLALGLVCTAIPYVLFFGLVREAGPQRASLVTYVNPAVAVLLGVLVLREPLSWAIVIGLALIVLGSWLASKRAAPAEAREALRPDVVERPA